MTTHGGRLLLALTLTLALIAAVVVLSTRFVARLYTVSGPSMEPALFPGDRVIVELWSYREGDPSAGDIVLFDGPGGGAMVKRVVPQPAGSNFVAVGEIPAIRPDESRFWVLGDNPAASADSRSFGAVPRHRVRGRVAWRYWPPSRAGSIR